MPPNSFSDEWDIFKDDLSNLYQLNDEGELSSRTRMLAATVNAGVDYALPVYRRLHFGLLNTTRINGDFTWTKFRLSANVKPLLNALSVNANIGYGTYGFDFGWLVNFSISGSISSWAWRRHHLSLPNRAYHLTQMYRRTSVSPTPF